MSEATDDSDDFDAAFAQHAADLTGEEAVEYAEEEQEDEATEGAEPEGEAPDEAETLKRQVAELSAALEAERHTARSNAGRVSALQRKLNDLQRTAPTGSASADNQGPGDANGDDEDAFGQDFPDVADFVKRTVEKVVEPVRSRYEQEDAERQAAAEAAAVRQAIQKLQSAHPDFDQIRSSPDYGEWLNRQAPKVREMALSMDADDAIALCSLYKGSRQTRTSRRSVIEAAEEIPSKGGAVRRTGVPDDFDSAFNHFAKNITTR